MVLTQVRYKPSHHVRVAKLIVEDGLFRSWRLQSKQLYIAAVSNLLGKTLQWQ